MNRLEFRRLVSDRVLVLDGATGTELFKRGLPPGALPEAWVLENPAVIQALHGEYYAAGSDIVLSCTFGANRLKLHHHHLDGKTRDMNIRLAEASRAIVPDGRLLFGDISATGQLVEPFGPLSFEEAVDVFREQAAALLAGGVDGFMIETMMDIQEARAALLAVREVAPDHAVIAGMTYERSGATLGGTTPEAALATLQALGADAVGCNCSFGPAEMLLLLERMAPFARVPLFIKPNAGMPTLRDGKNYYDLAATPFGDAVLRGVSLGARIVGGCCGTTPEHIRAVRGALDGMGGATPSSPPPAPAGLFVSSARGVVDFSDVEGRAAPLRVIGERINPTGKKTFQAELLKGDLTRVSAFAEEQIAAGADLLDVNFGLGGVDEAALIRTAITMLAPAVAAPLAIDTVNPAALEAALRLYPGRALVNSVSGEKERLERILPAAARYGAAIIVLPVADGFIPATAAERMEIVNRILAEAERLGLTPADALVDGLAMTVSADANAGAAALGTIERCTAAGLATVLGLSNISFGMPERKWLNASFLAMAMAAGLRAAIANPSSELLMETALSAGALLGRAGGTERYITRFAAAKAAPGAPRPAKTEKEKATPGEAAAAAVLKGRIKEAAAAARAAVESGTAAGELLSAHLVPAIVRAGELFEKNEYYLPQLMLAGEAMRLAVAAIGPELERERAGGAGSTARGRVIMATVKGDVHDIGKNLVALMLRNHGFDVTDLGKDVPAGEIVRAAREGDADIIGLSALMTTTLAAMRETIAAARGAGVAAAFMVGGAAVTEHFAGEIGADGFAADAVGAVRVAGELMEKRGTRS